MPNYPTISGYTIHEKLGQGTLTRAYLADHDTYGRVALKMLLPRLAKESAISKVFVREARKAKALAHNAIANVYEVKKERERYVLAEAYVPGRTIADALAQEGAFTPQRALRITATIARALAYAHREGILHLHITPDNIILRDDDTPVLTDFAIISAYPAERLFSGAKAPVYAAPEQMTGDKSDERSDIYLLGLVFYEMLTGCAPFAVGGTVSLREQHISMPPPALPDALSHLESLVAACLAKLPSDRVASGEEFALRLDDALAREAEHLADEAENPPRKNVIEEKTLPSTTRREGGLAALLAYIMRRPPVLAGGIAFAALLALFTGYAVGCHRANIRAENTVAAANDTVSITNAASRATNTLSLAMAPSENALSNAEHALRVHAAKTNIPVRETNREPMPTNTHADAAVTNDRRDATNAATNRLATTNAVRTNTSTVRNDDAEDAVVIGLPRDDATLSKTNKAHSTMGHAGEADEFIDIAIDDRYAITPSEEYNRLMRAYNKRHYGIDTFLLTEPKIIVVHSTYTKTLGTAVKMFCSSPRLVGRDDVKFGGSVTVSVHFIIDYDGTIYRLMPLTHAARHAIGLNYTAIGIENVGRNEDLTPAQVESTVKTILYIRSRCPTVEYLVGHYEYNDESRPHHHLITYLQKNYWPWDKKDPGVAFMRKVRRRLLDYDVAFLD